MINKDMSTQPTDAAEQYRLGLLYYKGEGVPQDYEQAVKWLTKAADQGNQYAQVHLGLMYANGVGVVQDLEQAFKGIRKAAEQGNQYAQSYLDDLFSQE